MNTVKKKRLLRSLGMVCLSTSLLTNTGLSAFAQTGVGVSVSIQQPGIYGRVDIGHYPLAQLVLAQPVVVAPNPVAIHRQPIYLYVPVAHRRGWGRYCGYYDACAQPVYFVRDQWGQQPHEGLQDQTARNDHGHNHRRNEKHNVRHDD